MPEPDPTFGGDGPGGGLDGDAHMTVTSGLWSDIEPRADHELVRLRGTLSLVTAPRVQTLLDKLLRDRGAVVVDLAGTELDWDPAAEVFPSALAAAGGWPRARLVLCAAGAGLADRLRALRIHRIVPLVADAHAAAARLRHRPDRVTRHRDLPHSTAAPAMARDLVHQACTDCAADAARDAAALIASEFVSNVVQHARTGCRVTVSVAEDGVRVSVRDYAPNAEPRPRPVDAGRAAGRGLHLVAVLSSAWGVQHHTDGKTTWAVIGLHG